MIVQTTAVAIPSTLAEDPAALGAAATAAAAAAPEDAVVETIASIVGSLDVSEDATTAVIQDTKDALEAAYSLQKGDTIVWSDERRRRRRRRLAAGRMLASLGFTLTMSMAADDTGAIVLPEITVEDINAELQLINPDAPVVDAIVAPTIKVTIVVVVEVADGEEAPVDIGEAIVGAVQEAATDAGIEVTIEDAVVDVSDEEVAPVASTPHVLAYLPGTPQDDAFIFSIIYQKLSF